MSTPAVERRRLALVSDEGRVDIAIPLGDRLGDALRAGGLPVGDGRHIVLDRDGTEIAPETPAIDLVDGGLYSVVDLRAGVAAAVSPARTPDGSRVDHGSAWWLLGVIAPLAIAVVVAGSPDAGIRLVTSAVLGLAALATAVAWAATARPGMTGAVALLAPVSLAFAAGALAPPPGLEDGARLAVAAGFLAAAVLSAVLTATAASAELRAAAGTVAIMLAVLAAIWGAALLLHWQEPAAAAVSLGAVPLALRALPSTLVNLPEGYFIDYRHFIGNRWTVRGAIPESPGAIRVESVRAVVDGSSARLAAGAAVLAIVAAVFAPVALLRPWGSDPIVVTGGVVLIVCVEISLLLTPRHTTGLLLRWLPRAAAGVVLVVATQLAIATFGALALVILAAVLFVAAVVAAALVVPVSRGASSLAWSRFGDVVEWVAVALALPAALLYADVLTLLRGMMAG